MSAVMYAVLKSEVLATHWSYYHKLVVHRLTSIPVVHSKLNFLIQEQRKQGVISASAGNHALALAYHGHLLKVPVVVVTPVTAPIMKVSTFVNLVGA